MLYVAECVNNTYKHVFRLKLCANTKISMCILLAICMVLIGNGTLQVSTRGTNFDMLYVFKSAIMPICAYMNKVCLQVYDCVE